MGLRNIMNIHKLIYIILYIYIYIYIIMSLCRKTTLVFLLGCVWIWEGI